MAKKMLVQQEERQSDMMEEGDEDTGILTVEDYPELEGISEGETIKGNWEAKVIEVKDGKVKIEYTLDEIETENSADRDLREMTKQTNVAIEEE